MAETFGQLIQRLRVQLGLTQIELARKVGVPMPTLRNWENDHREPYFRLGVRLAAALGVRPETLAASASAAEVGRTPRAAGPRLGRKSAAKR